MHCPSNRTGQYTALILRLGFPVLLTQLGIIAVSFADTMMVGVYGTDELAAAAFVNNFFMVAIMMQIGFALGVTPLVGSLYARGRALQLGRTLQVGLRLNAVMSIGFTTLMGILYFFLDRMGQPEELLPLIRPYYLVVLCTLFPGAIFNCCRQTANGVTDTAMPMWVILGCNALNIFGNWLLIFGHWGAPELGLLGAGVSTLVSRWTGAAVILSLLMYGRRYSPYRRGFREAFHRRPRSSKLFATSWPVMIQNGIECLMWSLGAVVCGWFGTLDLAAYQVTVTLSQLGFMPYVSFAIAVSIIVANCNGAGNIEGMRRATAAGLRIILILCVIASLSFVCFGRGIIGLFTSDTEVISLALMLIPPLVLYQFLDGTQICYANALRGTSNVRPLFMISIVSYVVVGIPAMLLLGVALDMHAVGVYYSFSIGLLVAAVLLVRSFRSTLRGLAS